MSAQRQWEPRFTEAEYWELEQNSPTKHEFLDGQVYAMAGASPVHNDIALNVASSLKAQLRGRPCVARISDQRLKIATADLQTYPDVLVACPPLRYDPNNSHTLLDATVLVEVLSPSTARNDRNAKFDAYKGLSSLRHYLLIEQNSINVEHHFLDDAGSWQSEVWSAPDDAVNLAAVSCQLSLNEIYEDVEL